MVLVSILKLEFEVLCENLTGRFVSVYVRVIPNECLLCIMGNN
jgi:hypothetical protein